MKSNTISGFCDFSVLSNNVSEISLEDTFKTLVRLGYRTVAIDHVLEETVFESKKKKKKGEPRDNTDLVPPPRNIAKLVKKFQGKLQILHRLTYTFSDNLQAHKVNQSENVRKYNFLAVLPTTESALQHACTTLEVDIITFNPEGKNRLRFNRKMYNMAADRGIYFELMYAPSIRDATARKNTISMAHMYHAYGKSKNIIISSGTSYYMHIRGPYDIINLTLIFGLSEEQSKGAILSRCKALFIKAEGRRYGKAVITVSQRGALDEEKSEDETEDMEVDDVEPAQKRLRQTTE